ncbi:hypothetical protein BB559_001763 [Furculomyces boomerangus]|uniref:Uncharacterized protein n=2 Tax=Harpellales TaxID=61421 RepID=A0A2T9Z0R9_9FUNG|nr:hypothetical protein BB559_001763 [Furculomyces boomerangus]PVZ99287.1 hypothetical protein BB558_004704 [Smittium angustum]
MDIAIQLLDEIGLKFEGALKNRADERSVLKANIIYKYVLKLVGELGNSETQDILLCEEIVKLFGCKLDDSQNDGVSNVSFVDNNLKQNVKFKVRKDLDMVLESASEMSVSLPETGGNKPALINQISLGKLNESVYKEHIELIKATNEYFEMLALEGSKVLEILSGYIIESYKTGVTEGLNEGVNSNKHKDFELCQSIIRFYSRLVNSMFLKLKLFEMGFARQNFSKETLDAIRNVSISLDNEFGALMKKHKESESRLQVYMMGGDEFSMICKEYSMVVKRINELLKDIKEFS